MRISLVQKDLVDKIGVDYRLSEDIAQLQIPYTTDPPEGFQDFGEVTWNNVKYYMSGYTPPTVAGEDG